MNDKTLATPSPRRRLSSGRPAPHEFFGLFLPSWEWELKTECIAWHELENEPNATGTVFRNMRREDVNPNESFLRVLPTIRAKLPPQIAAQLDTVAQAIENGTFTDDLVAKLPGRWAAFCFGATNEKSPYCYEYASVEAACKDADSALHRDDYRHAADLIQRSLILRQYWSDAALQGLAESKSRSETFPPRIQAWLQLQIAVLAKWSIQDQLALQAREHCGTLENLLTEVRPDGAAAPGAMWLRCMQRLTAAKSLPTMLVLLSNKSALLCDLPSEATIKRWSRGSHFPLPSTKFEKFVARVGDRAAITNPSMKSLTVREAVSWYWWAARRFDSILWFASRHVADLSNPDDRNHPLTPSDWLRAEFRRWQALYKLPPVLSLV